MQRTENKWSYSLMYVIVRFLADLVHPEGRTKSTRNRVLML